MTPDETLMGKQFKKLSTGAVYTVTGFEQAQTLDKDYLVLVISDDGSPFKFRHSALVAKDASGKPYFEQVSP